MLSGKNKTGLYTLYFFHFFEIMQIISFASDKPHFMTWKIDTNKFYIISTTLSSFRLIPLSQFISFFAFKFIFFVLVVIAFALSLFLIIQITLMDNNSKIFNRFLSFTFLIMEPLYSFYLYI